MFTVIIHPVLNIADTVFKFLYHVGISCDIFLGSRKEVRMGFLLVCLDESLSLDVVLENKAHFEQINVTKKSFILLANLLSCFI